MKPLLNLAAAALMAGRAAQQALVVDALKQATVAG